MTQAGYYHIFNFYFKSEGVYYLFIYLFIYYSKIIQAPAWNSAVRRFANSDDILFGDINLSEQNIRGNHQPGAGGWPTIRYFNKKTGIEGASYDKKTPDAMCDELGKEEYMESYIMEAGSTSLCKISAKESCSDKESKFVDSWTQKSIEAVESELNRLQNVKTAKVTSTQKLWFSQRISILKQLIKKSQQTEL